MTFPSLACRYSDGHDSADSKSHAYLAHQEMMATERRKEKEKEEEKRRLALEMRKREMELLDRIKDQQRQLETMKQEKSKVRGKNPVFPGVFGHRN